MGKVLILAAYAVYAAFWIRFLLHALVWWRAAGRLTPETRLHAGFQDSRPAL